MGDAALTPVDGVRWPRRSFVERHGGPTYFKSVLTYIQKGIEPTLEGMEEHVQASRDSYLPRTSGCIVQIYDTESRLESSRRDTRLE
jgi:hypothetical protein